VPSKELNDTFDDIVRALASDARTRVRVAPAHDEEDALTLEGLETIRLPAASSAQRTRL